MNRFKKIAAHYWLRPDGSVGKFPVITFDSDNKIVEIRERDTFKEEASLLLINGFLVPGLLDYGTAALFSDEPATIQKYLNKLFVQGIRVLGVNHDVYGKLEMASRGNILLVKTDLPCDNRNLPMGFAKIQEAKDSMGELTRLTIYNAKAMGIDHFFGSLEVGKSPGLLVISNIDYDTFSMDKNSKLKGVV